MMHDEIILGGGCFWGVQDLLRKLPGVLETEVGYSGGTRESARYSEVKKGKTGHAEVVRVRFDPSVLSLKKIFQYFFRLHDPTTLHRQGNDVGTQYRSVIFYKNELQKEEALKAIADPENTKRWKNPIVTEVVPFESFTAAEPEHQDYLLRYPDGYTCHWLRD